MPSTYNGIGTRYSGQTNVQTRQATCNFCHRQVSLKSYDTRLWFTILYIPVIPLGRKRITDYCPACTRHFVAPLHKWETAKQLSISGALQEFHQDPTPDNAVKVHQQLIGFRQFPEAAEFRKIIGQQFRDNARVQLYLGEELAGIGQHQEAQGYYQRALELRPDLPQANVGIAREAIRRGKLDDARKLLAFLEQPGAAQMYSLEPIETLANAFQKSGRHADALELYDVLLKALPSAGQHDGFRKRVKTSEKALKRKPSILPKKKFSLRGLFSRKGGNTGGRGRIKLATIGVVIIIGAIVMACVNENTRRHRTLYVINGFDKPATVSIDGHGVLQAQGHSLASATLPEGVYHAHITGPVDEAIDFEIKTGYFDRFGGTPAWVVNVGGGALLQEEHGHYSANTTPREPDFDFFFGQPFLMFPQMDHPFQDLPHEISVDSNEGEKTLTNLLVFHGKPINAVGYLSGKGRNDDAVRLAQWELKHHPDDVETLFGYSGFATEIGKRDQFVKFLQDGLSARPVAVEWHRLYQESKRNSAADLDKLIAEYDAMLQKEPGNSALLYLRGRIAKTRQEGLDYFNCALKADPKNAYAYYALGYDSVARGEWNEALPLLTKAVDYGNDAPEFRHVLNDALFGLGDYAAVEKDARERLQKEPLDRSATMDLMNSLLERSLAGGATETVNTYENRQRQEGDSNPDQSLRAALLYATKNTAGLQALPIREKADKELLCYSLMEQGRPDSAESQIPLVNTDNDDAFYDISMATAWLLAGDSARASAWADGAAKCLQASGDDDLGRAGKFIGETTAPSIEDVQNLIISPDDKAILAAYLALRHPDQAAAFAKMAALFNIRPEAPHNLVAQAVAKTVPAP